MLKEDSTWHLDKRVSIGFIITIAIQTSAYIWYASKMDSRVETLETANVENAEVNRIVYGIGAELKSMNGSLVRIEHNQESDRKRINRLIERKD